MRPALYKRIADIALFLSGIFPEHAAHSSGSRKNMFLSQAHAKRLRAGGKTLLPRRCAGNGSNPMETGSWNARGEILLGTVGAQ